MGDTMLLGGRLHREGAGSEGKPTGPVDGGGAGWSLARGCVDGAATC